VTGRRSPTTFGGGVRGLLYEVFAVLAFIALGAVVAALALLLF